MAVENQKNNTAFSVKSTIKVQFELVLLRYEV